MLVDCTVPLAAAVSGKATRSLGVWQGSAAQQAQEMVPDGVTVVAGLHTISALMLADTGAELAEDVLLCGDRKSDKAQVAGLIEEIPGLRAVNAGPLEMARIVEQLTPLLISITPATRRTRESGSAACRTPTTGRERAGRRDRPAMTVVCLAGGTGGEARRRAPGPGRRPARGDREHGRRHRGPRLLVCPDPDLITYWLADEIDEERGWGIRDDALSSTSASSSSGRPAGSASPTATWPPVCTAPTSSPRAAP